MDKKIASNEVIKPYYNKTFILATKHGKSVALSSVFGSILGAGVVESYYDTDIFGTFTGEVERKFSPIECAKRKCERAVEIIGNRASLFLSSEGSFIPNPHLPFMYLDHEILYFIDKERDYHLSISHISGKTNYTVQKVQNFKHLLEVASDVKFPSHALVLSAKNNKGNSLIFKGIDSFSNLEMYFNECLVFSKDNFVQVQTDMRANYNPTRMEVIGELATIFADRLSSLCLNCGSPGWGLVENGAKDKVLGCVKCNHVEYAYKEMKAMHS
jgi:hypothetical protein